MSRAQASSGRCSWVGESLRRLAADGIDTQVRRRELNPALGPGPHKVTHTDLSSPYDPGVRALLRRPAREAWIESTDGAGFGDVELSIGDNRRHLWIEGASDRLYRLVGQALQLSVIGTAE